MEEVEGKALLRKVIVRLEVIKSILSIEGTTQQVALRGSIIIMKMAETKF